MDDQQCHWGISSFRAVCLQFGRINLLWKVPLVLCSLLLDEWRRLARVLRGYLEQIVRCAD